MATEIGKAYVQIVPSANGLGNKIQDDLNNQLKKTGETLGNSMGEKIVGTIKKVVLAMGIGKIISSSLNYGAELQQNLGGTEAVFAKHAEVIKTKAVDAYKNMGLSASDYMATANKMGSLFQGSGVSIEKSVNLTADAMQRAADVASVMGLDTNMAMESIAGAAKRKLYNDG